MPDYEINTSNLFMVGMMCTTPSTYQVLNLRALQSPISKADALNLAAYLVAIAEEEPGEFQLVLNAVQEL